MTRPGALHVDRVALPPEAERVAKPFRIVAIADTHSRPHPRALERVLAEAPDLVLHAGDIGDLAVLSHFAAIAPLLAVTGNIDGRLAVLPETRHVLLEDAGRVALSFLLTHIAVAGPKLTRPVRELARREGAGLVVCGHSHVPFVAMDGPIAIFNPGSIGPRRFHLPIVLGVIELGRALRFRHVDCETGLDWAPPR